MAGPIHTHRRVALLLEYDGTQYSGWQRQLNAPSIQEVLENTFRRMLGRYINVIAAGRTDAGVHALGQVAHVDLPSTVTLPPLNLAKALNTMLPPDIRILWCADVPGDFHARFAAIHRTYLYTLTLFESVFYRHYAWQLRYTIDPALLQQSAGIFVGEYDFTTFSKFNADTRNYICNVDRCEWRLLSPGVWQLVISANRFVYGMVRSLVGAMVDVAQGKRTIAELQAALEQKDRALNSPLAPARGLVLAQVRYDPDPFAPYYQQEHVQHHLAFLF